MGRYTAEVVVMYRSPSIPTEPNRRKHWRAEVEDSGYFTVAYWTSEEEHRHGIMGVMCFGHPNRARAVTLPHHDVPGLKTIARAYSLWSMNRRAQRWS